MPEVRNALSKGLADSLYLLLDGTNSMAGHITADTASSYDIGESLTEFRTLYLENDGGNVIVCRPVQSGDGHKSYTMHLGGGQYGSEQNQGGTFTFFMAGIGSSLGTSENYMIFDVGNVDWAAAAASNDIQFQSFNGISTYAFVSSFGGFNQPEYGFELKRLTGAETTSKTFIFDNQVPASSGDFRRTIDLRLDGTNVLTLENETTLGAGDFKINMPIGILLAPSGLDFRGTAGRLVLNTSSFFGVTDFIDLSPGTTNSNYVGRRYPDGTGVDAVNFFINSSDVATNYGVFEIGIDSTIARINTWRQNAGSGVTQFIIGEAVSSFLGAGTCDSLTTIDFFFANAIEMQIQPDTIVFNNGTTDTQIDWATDGEMGLQVNASDIIRISSSKAQVTQELEIDGDLNHDGSNIGFFATAPVAKAAALTTALTQITHTGPTTPDYAIATPINTNAWGFSTQDEFETIMSVILNLQTRVDELESRLQAYGLLT